MTCTRTSREWRPGLADCPNAVLLPHLGSATHATRAAMSRIAGENLVAVLQGRRPANPVNPEVFGEAGGGIPDEPGAIDLRSRGRLADHDLSRSFPDRGCRAEVAWACSSFS